MRTKLLFFCFMVTCGSVIGQKKTTSQIKTELQAAQNPFSYVRDVLKRKYRLDTVPVVRIGSYQGIADSLAYHGQIKKVYGPYDRGKILVQVLAKLPNTFYRVSQIYLDTTVFSRKFADSIGNSIIDRIKGGSATFQDMAMTYSMGGEGITKGDMGWIAQGYILPEIEKEINRHKKGEIFKVWSRSGLHIIQKTDNPKKDNGVALLMRVFL